MKHKFVIVLGHESSGTRLVAETIAKASGFAYDDGEHRTDEQGQLVDTFLTKEVQSWWDDPNRIVCDQSRVSRRSLPHGGIDARELQRHVSHEVAARSFPNPWPLIGGLERAGYDVRVVLTVRDRSIAISSKCRVHTKGNFELASDEMQRAGEIMVGLLEKHPKTFVCSYEALMSLGRPYLSQLYAFLGIETDYLPKLRDGNAKYVIRMSPDLRIGLVTRQNEQKWGGDLRALNSVQVGLEAEGFEVRQAQMAVGLLDCDFVFLTNTCNDQRTNMEPLLERDIPFGLIGFHEDFLRYYGVSMGFTEYVSMCLQKLEDEGIQLRIEDLWDNPEAVRYYNHEAPKTIFYNVPVLRNARFCLAASHSEAATMKRDCPHATTEVVYWNIGLSEKHDDYSDEFLRLTGLTRGEYMLQVGRLETRKNQLASILATKNLDMPLVLIATKGYQQWYELLAVNAAAGHRKAPTLIVSEEHPTQKIGGAARILQMPHGQRLSEGCLRSAFQNCGLYLHPAFWETPGYTYLEAAKIGMPIVASSWGSVRDYCEFGGNDPYMNDRFTYVTPYHLPEIEQAVARNFGRKVDPRYDHPIFSRTAQDVGKEIAACIRKHSS